MLWTLSLSSAGNLPKRPNILFLLADDLGWGDVHYNGGVADTPNLDAMACGNSSVQFTRHYSGAPVCSPTRGTVLTGRNHNRYCIWRANTHSRECNWTTDFQCPAIMPLPPSEITVGEVLQSAGYRTAAFGKWHLGDLKRVESGHPQWSPSHPGMHGFDVWKVTERAVPTVNPNCACFDPETCRIGRYTDAPLPACTNYYRNVEEDDDDDDNSPSSITGNSSSLNSRHSTSPPCPAVGHPGPILGDDSLFIAEQVKSYINESVSSLHPFFAYVAFHAPHSRYIADSAYATRYREKGFGGKEKEYYGAIEGLDHAIGEILSYLDDLGLRDSTLVWFTSDNGPAGGSPGSTNGLRGRKGTLYEGGIRVPGIIRWPAVIEENTLTSYPVSTNDFLPTIMDVTGTRLPDSRQLDGASILPLLLGRQTTRSSTIHWAFKINNGDFSSKYNAVSIKGDIKLHIMFKHGVVASSNLYNITVDERTDISSELPVEFRYMRKDLVSWTESLENSASNEVHCIS